MNFNNLVLCIAFTNNLIFFTKFEIGAKREQLTAFHKR